MWYKIFDWCAMPVTLVVTLYIAFKGEVTWQVWVIAIPVVIVNEFSKVMAYNRAFKEAVDKISNLFEHANKIFINYGEKKGDGNV